MEERRPMRTMFAVTTVDDREVSEGAIFTLLDSIDPSLMSVLLVCRDVGEATHDVLAAHPSVMALHHIGRSGLSVARNAGLSELVRRGVPGDAIVCFPDDDCYYPAGLLQRVAERLAPGADLLLGVYGEGEAVNPAPTRPLSFKDVFRSGNSVGIFVQLSLARAAGGFDTRMGVGSGEVPAAEDIEFLARCLSQPPRQAIFDPSVVVRHPISEGPPERAGAYLAVAVRYWRERQSWVRLSRTVIGSLTGFSPVPRSRLIHLLRPRRRRGWYV